MILVFVVHLHPTFEKLEIMNKIDGYLKQFVVQFSGLKNGLHTYEFEIGDLFFERFKIEDVTGGEIHLNFSLTKKDTSMVLEFDFSGILHGVCDRCLDPLDFIVANDYELQVKFGEETNTENDELLILGYDAYKIDIAPMVYEFISLSVPLRKVHDEENCNPEVMKQLNNGSFEEYTENETPSIWENLKKLK